MTLALVFGALLALSALAYVLYPLFVRSPSAGAARSVVVRPRLHRGDPAIVALREIEMDRAMGKLSEADYDHLRERLECGRTLDRACPGCGVTVEVEGANYCANCGTNLGA